MDLAPQWGILAERDSSSLRASSGWPIVNIPAALRPSFFLSEMESTSTDGSAFPWFWLDGWLISSPGELNRLAMVRSSWEHRFTSIIGGKPSPHSVLKPTGPRRPSAGHGAASRACERPQGFAVWTGTGGRAREAAAGPGRRWPARHARPPIGSRHAETDRDQEIGLPGVGRFSPFSAPYSVGMGITPRAALGKPGRHVALLEQMLEQDGPTGGND